MPLPDNIYKDATDNGGEKDHQRDTDIFIREGRMNGGMEAPGRTKRRWTEGRKSNIERLEKRSGEKMTHEIER